MIIDKKDTITEKTNIQTQNDDISNTVVENNDTNLEKDKIFEESEKIEEKEEKKEQTAETNCLALTVRKDYNLSIFKNTVFTTFRVTFKIALSTVVLNFLRLFF